MLAASLAAAAVAGAVATVAVRGGQAASAAPAPPQVATATVMRTNLVSTALTGRHAVFTSTGDFT